MIKAFLCGINKYTFLGNLEYCSNDVSELYKVLQFYLNVKKEDIQIATNDGIIDSNKLIEKISNFYKDLHRDDLVIFYFSGHGNTNNIGEHYLCATDTVDSNEDSMISTELIINFIANSEAKSNLIILDCCHSDIGKNILIQNFKVDKALEDFYQKGCAVFSSCSSSEMSYPYNDKNISAFTQFICDAIKSPSMIKDGSIYLDNLVRLVKLYSKVWSAKHPDTIQTPVFRTNILGNIAFKVEESKPVIKQRYKASLTDFIIYNIEFQKKCINNYPEQKMYIVTLIKKVNLDFNNYFDFLNGVIQYVSKVNIPPKSSGEKRVYHQPVSCILLCIGNDDIDMAEDRFEFRVMWATIAKEKWLQSFGDKAIKIADMAIIKNPQYSSLKTKRLEDVLNDKDLLHYLKKRMGRIIYGTEEFLYAYKNFENKEITKEQLDTRAELIYDKIQIYFNQIDNTPFAIPGSMLKGFCDCSLDFSVTMNSIFFIYFSGGKNTHDLLSLEISNYYYQLNKWMNLKKG